MAVVLNTGLDRETADDVQAGRPAPDLIHAAMGLVGEEDPRAVVSMGETVSDLEGARAWRRARTR